MELKLKSLFRGPPSALALKAILFAGFLLLVKASNFGFIPVAFFLFTGLLLYNTPARNGLFYVISFASLTLLALLWGVRLGGAAYFIVPAAAAFLFYILLGLKNIFFLYRERWHYFLLLALFYGTGMLFFSADKSSSFSFLAALLFALLFVFLISYEFFRVSVFGAAEVRLWERASRAALSSLTALFSAIMAGEVFWIISFLPIGFVNSANLSLIAYFGVSDLIKKHFAGLLSRHSILTSITICVILTLIIFAVSSWRI